MDRRKLALLEALRSGAQQRGETRLYRRGKLPGLFGQRTRANADLANQAVADGLLEITRIETVGKNAVEWVRLTQKGLDYLLESESPIHALEELRDVLTINQDGLPRWVAEMNARISEQAHRYADEVEAMRVRLDHLSQQVTAAIARLEAAKKEAPAPVAWAQAALDFLERREQVGLGPRCPLADLFTTLREKGVSLTIREFHQGLKRMQDAKSIDLLPSPGNGDAPGPEYALLDAASVYYYVARASGG
jgi:hypothetical protein